MNQLCTLVDLAMVLKRGGGVRLGYKQMKIKFVVKNINLMVKKVLIPSNNVRSCDEAPS